MKDWVVLQYKKSPLTKAIHGRKRKAPKVSKKKTKINKFTLPRFNSSFLIGTIFLIITIVLLFGSFYYFRYVDSLVFKSDFDVTADKEDKITPGNKANIIVYPFIEESGYKFILAPTLFNIDFDNGRYGALTMHPYFRINESVSIQNYFNSLALTDEKPTFLSLSEQVESSFGVQIDSYISFNIDMLSEEDAALFRESLNKETSEEQLLYATGSYLDELTSVYEDTFSENTSFFQKLGLFFSLDSLSEKEVYTNLDSSYIVTLANSIESFSPLGFKESLNSIHSFKTTDSLPLLLDQNSTVVNEVISDSFRDIQVIQEQAEVEIYNATKQRGLASSISRILENNGVNIVKFGNSPDEVEKTEIYIPEGDLNTYPATIEKIDTVLEGNYIYSEDEYRNNFSGNIIIILGE